MDRLRIIILIWLVSGGDYRLKEVKTKWEVHRSECWNTQEMNQEIILTGNWKNRGETTGLYRDGKRTHCFHWGGQMKCWKLEIFYIYGKERNRNMKMTNGNGSMRQNILAIHWNMGARKWSNKKLK